MSQNPYAQNEPVGGQQYSDFGDGSPRAAERTSVLSILSLVFGLLFCVPFLGLLGVLMGLGAVVGITRSGGRVSGMPLAVLGIVFGLIASVLWVGGVYGATQMMQGVTAGITQSIQTIERGDPDEVRAIFHQDLRDEVTAERLDAFRDEYTDKLGAFRGGPSGILQYMAWLGEAEQQMNQAMQEMERHGYAAFPVPAEFENGRVVVMIGLRPNGNQDTDLRALSRGEWLRGSVGNIAIVTMDGDVIWFIDPEDKEDGPDAPDGSDPDAGEGEEGEGGPAPGGSG